MTAIFKEEKNPKFLAVVHSDIIFDKEFYKGGKKYPIAFTIVEVLAGGWSKVPYVSSGSKQKQQNQKKLSEMVINDDDCKTMKMWTFEKATINMDRGERVDDSFWLIHVGDTFLMWLDEKRIVEIKEIIACKESRIPALSLCEIELQSKNNDQVSKGTGVKISNIQVSNFSLYSCMNTLTRHGPKSFNEARSNAVQRQTDYEGISRDLQSDRLGFFVQIDKTAVIDDERCEEYGTVHIVGWGGKDVIDIPIEVLKKYTNVDNVEQACQLLEVAIAMESLSVYVVNNEFKRGPVESTLKGIPLIDTEKMLASVDASAIDTSPVFQTPYTAVIDDVTYAIEIEIDPVPKTTMGDGINRPLSEDFIIVGRDVEIAKGYKIKIRYISPDEEVLNMFVGFLNSSTPAASIAVGFKRRRITPFDD